MTYYEYSRPTQPLLNPTYTFKNGNQCCQTIYSWYIPVYTVDDENPSIQDSKPRYCNGRLSRRAFVALHCLLIAFLLTVIVGPIMYAVVIPNMIRERFATTSLDELKLFKMHVQSFTDDGLTYAIQLQLPPQYPLPLTASLDRAVARVETSDGSILAKITLPPLPDVTISNDINLSIEGENVQLVNTEKLEELIADISSGEFQGTTLYVKSDLSISMFGVLWYRNLDVERPLPIPAVKNSLIELYNVIPQFVFTDYGKALRKQLLGPNDELDPIADPSESESESANSVDPASWWQFLHGFPPVHVRKIDIGVTDVGMKLELGVSFENPVILALPDAELAFNMKLEGSHIAHVEISGLTLVDGMNDVDIALTTILDSPDYPVNPGELSNAVAIALSKILSTVDDDEDINLNLTGPISMPLSPIIETFTGPLSISFPVKAILECAHFAILRDMVTPSGIKSLLSTVNLDSQITSEAILSNINIKLPHIIPLPSNINFPYTTSVSMAHNNVNCMKIVTGALSISCDDSGMSITTSVALYPENTPQAADAFAALANPVLAGRAGTIGIKDMSFASTANSQPYAWSKKVLGMLDIHIPVPGGLVDISKIVAQATKDGTSLPASIHGMHVAQMTNAPGFAATGDVKIDYPPTLPVVTLKLDYLSMDVALDSTLAAQTIMGSGIQYSPTAVSTHIDAQAHLIKDSAIGTKISQLLNFALSAVDGDDAEHPTPPVVNIKGLKFGVSAAAAFQTFSKIIVPLDIVSLKPALVNAVNSILAKALQPRLVKVNKASLKVISGTRIGVGIGCKLNNPFPISAHFGPLDVSLLLDGEFLAKTAIKDVELHRDQSQLPLKAVIKLAKGDNGMSTRLGKFVSDVISKKSLTDVLSISNIVLTPPGGSAQSDAIIDHLKDVTIIIPSSIVAIAGDLLSDRSPVDVFGLFPRLRYYLKVRQVKEAHFETKHKSSLSASADFSYENPLPVSVECGFFDAVAFIDDTRIMRVNTKDISLAKGSGSMKPSMNLKFTEDSPDVPVKVAQVFKGLLGGKIKQKLGVTEIYFGSSSDDVNDLFSKVSLSMAVDKINTKGLIKRVIESLPVKLPIPLKDVAKQFKPSIHALKLKTESDRRITAKTELSLKLPFPVTAKIGYFEVRFGISDAKFMTVAVSGMHVSPGHVKNLKLDVKVKFSDDSSLPSKVAHLFRDITSSHPDLSSTLNFAGLKIGVSEDDHITTLSQVKISLALRDLVKGNVDVDSMIGSYVDDASVSFHDKTVGLELGHGIEVKIKSADVTMQPHKTIGAKLVFALKMPVNDVYLDVGCFVVDLGFDKDLKAITSRVTDIQAADGVDVKPHLHVKVHDSPALAEKMAEIARLLYGGHSSTTAHVRGVAFGHSHNDLVRCFEEVKIVLKVSDLVDRVVKGVRRKLRDVDATKMLDFFGLKVRHVDAKTLPGQKLFSRLRAEMKPFPISAKIPFSSVHLGLDEVPMIEHEILDFVLAKNDKKLDTKMVMHFPTSKKAQDKVKKFIEDIEHGLKKTKQDFRGSGLTFGYSKTDHIKALSKAIVYIPSSHINREVVDRVLKDMGVSRKDLTIDSMIDRHVIYNAILDMAKRPGHICADVEAGLSGIPLGATADIGYVHLRADLNGKDLANCALPKGMKLHSRDGSVSVKIESETRLFEDEPLQREIAWVAEHVVDGGNMVGDVGVRGMIFGHSESDVIDLFSTAHFRHRVDPYVPRIRKFVKEIYHDVMKGDHHKYGIEITELVADIVDTTTLSTKAGANVRGLPDNIRATVPYASAVVSFNGKRTVESRIHDITFRDKKFKMTAFMVFTPNDDVVRRMSTIGGDIVFHRPIDHLDDVLSVTKLVFGSGRDRVFRTAEKVNVKIKLNSHVQDVYEYVDKHRPLEIFDIQSELTPKGIHATVRPQPFRFMHRLLPLTVKIPSMTGRVYHRGIGITTVHIIPSIKDGKDISLDFMIMPDEGLHKALAEATPLLLSYKSYTEHASIGGLKINFQKEYDDARNEESFRIFESSRIDAPPLYFFDPLEICRVKIHLLKRSSDFTLGIPKNSGPLAIKVGSFKSVVQQGDKSVAVIQAGSELNPVLIKNINQGGVTTASVHTQVHLSGIANMIFRKGQFKISTYIENEGKQITWLNEVFDSLTQPLMNEMGPILVGMKKNLLFVDANGFYRWITERFGVDAVHPTKNKYRWVHVKDECGAQFGKK